MGRVEYETEQTLEIIYLHNIPRPDSVLKSKVFKVSMFAQLLSFEPTTCTHKLFSEAV